MYNSHKNYPERNIILRVEKEERPKAKVSNYYHDPIDKFIWVGLIITGIALIVLLIVIKFFSGSILL